MYPRRIFQIFLCIAIYSYSVSPLNKTLNANNDHNHVCFLVCEAWKRDGGGKLVSRGGKSLVTLVPDSPLQLHWRRPLYTGRSPPVHSGMAAVNNSIQLTMLIYIIYNVIQGLKKVVQLTLFLSEQAWGDELLYKQYLLNSRILPQCIHCTSFQTRAGCCILKSSLIFASSLVTSAMRRVLGLKHPFLCENVTRFRLDTVWIF